MNEQREKTEELQAYNICTRCKKVFDHLGVENCDKCGGRTDLKLLKPSEFVALQKCQNTGQTSSRIVPL